MKIKIGFKPEKEPIFTGMDSVHFRSSPFWGFLERAIFLINGFTAYNRLHKPPHALVERKIGFYLCPKKSNYRTALKFLE